MAWDCVARRKEDEPPPEWWENSVLASDWVSDRSCRGKAGLVTDRNAGTCACGLGKP